MHTQKTTNQSQQNTVVEPSSNNTDIFQRALSLHQQGQLEQAELLYEQLLTAQPQRIDALHFFGVLKNQNGQSQRAVELISEAIKIAPNNAAAHSNLGLALQELNRFDEAIASYDRSLALKPNNPEAYYNRGNALLALKRFNETLVDYERALAIKPDYIEALSNRGIVLDKLDRLDEALANYQHILTIKPDSAEAEQGCGVILQKLKRDNEAIIHYDRALALKPDLDFVLGTRLNSKMNICAWHEFEHDLDELTKAIEQGEKVSIPFIVQAVSSSASLQKKAAEIYTQERHPSNFLAPPLVKHKHSKIKIGYFSSDFCHHPVAYLTAELFERHDRSRFEIIAFAFNAVRQKDDMRLRLEAGFDQFFDVSQYSDEQIVRLARQLEIDIAVDLNGCTDGCRTDIFAMRVAPIQVNYIGYLGTMSADYIDYLLADRVLIPTEHLGYYHEKIAYLPHSFQVNDSTLAISSQCFTRTELGLPEQGFVFCCFNNHYKITLSVFASWMRILQQVEGSVLWLLGGNVDAETNLRLSATRQGITAERLVFAQRAPMPEYLARHRLADLFLDTSPYNAGATASAALWAGLPLLTCIGSSYSSRMAASLLNAIGLPELVTETWADYEALATKLATNPEQLATLKQKLVANRLTYPLFNTKLFTQHIESAFQAMFDRYQADLAPDHIYVATEYATKSQQPPLLTTNIANTIVDKNQAERPNPQSFLAKITQKPAQLFASISVFGKRKNKKQPLVGSQKATSPTDVDKFAQAQQLHHLGQLSAAETLYEEFLKIQPEHAEALRCLAAIKKQRQARMAVNVSSHTQSSHSSNAQTVVDKNCTLPNLPSLDARTISFNSHLAIELNPADELINRGNELEDQGRFYEALACYDQTLSIQPDYARAHSNRGNVLQSLKQFDEAIASYDRAIAIKADYAEAFYNRGNTLLACKRFQEAITSYDRALVIKPDLIQAFIGRGNALHDCRQFSEALKNYDHVLSIQPGYAEALFNRGNVLLDIKRLDEALNSYESALKIKPDYAEAFVGCGVVLQELKRFSDASSSYERALAIKPNLEFTLGDFLNMKINSCDWYKFDDYVNQLAQKLERGEKPSSPFPVQIVLSSIALQKKAATSYAEAKYPSAFLSPPLVKHTHSKIKIAYFSSDFRHHPVAYLTAELFERHDRSRFEIIAFSFDATQNKDDMRLRLEAGFDQFIDVSLQSDEQIVRLARELEIDIAVDLNGFTKGCRANLFAMRVAPVQVSYLGYLGTMGVDYMDYLLADVTLIPTEHQPYYNEKIAYLPNSFQVNDSTQAIADKSFTRAELGLPENGFVFCCFNNNYKITPAVFASWMRILHQVDNSVLWLLGNNLIAAKNLQREATNQGIAVDRLIFANRLPMPEYLVRHRVADLFLDTSPYNAGATASASLWAGLPIITCLGETFAGRMAASLLYAIGLPELVTQTPKEYEALAIKLATNSDQLATIKQKLADNRLTFPLFDTKLFTKHIESVFQMMFDRYQAGLAPDHIYVQALTNSIELRQATEQQTTQNFKHFDNALITESSVEELINLGNELEDSNHLEDALASYDRALSIDPDYPRAHSNRGNVLQSLSRFDEAIASYDHALAIKPDYVEAFYNRGNALQALKRFDEALISYDRALAIKPEFVIALIGRGAVLQDLQRFDDALVSYDHAITIAPDYPQAHYNRGNVLQELKRLDDALLSYGRALTIKPDYIEALANRGCILQDLKRFVEALADYDRVVALSPKHIDVLARRGIVLQVLNRLDEALSNCEHALAIQPDREFMFGTWLSLKMKLCDWRDFELNIDKLTQKITRGEKAFTPFFVHSITASLALQKKAAEIYVQAKCPSDFLAPALIKHAHSKIKLAYFSSDFRNHPVAYLTAEMFERHDRSRFEVLGFSFSPNNHKAETRLRLEAAFDQFIDVSQQSDEQVVRLAREMEIDIAIDLNGFTDGCRPKLFAMRVAPIQVSYLGYLGTMGADYIDYLLADKTLIPVEHQAYYAEKTAYLPHSFQVNDSKMVIADKNFTRAELGLPNKGFVFCCFNNNFKITPTVFASWIRILQQVDGSVLWLLEDNAVAAKNLRHEAIAQGITAERIIFAQRQPMPEYLARHRAADLFLDTTPYNAGATASAALWSGLPIVTCLGETFAGRMAASLLYAIGLPELVTQTPKEYEALAIKLATNPEQLAAIKQKLADNRLTYPLFNTALFTQHLEFAFQTMFNRYQAGLAPDHINVPTQIDNAKPVFEAPQQSQVIETKSDKFQLAFSLHQQGQLAEAERLYEEIAQTESKNADVLHFWGILKNQNGQTQGAIELLQQSLNINPDNADAHLNLAMILQVINRLDDALVSYDHALAIKPDYADALFNRANFLLTQPDFEQALANYNQVLTINPNYVEALCNRGIALQGLHRFEDALANYNHALTIKPDYAEVLTNRGNILKELKRFNEALDSYDRALVIAPDDVETLSNRGNVLQELKRLDEALESYEHALECNQNYTEALSNRGNVLHTLNRYEEALASYDLALAIKPDYAEALIGCGAVLQGLKRFDEAIFFYERALAIKPDHEFLFGDWLFLKMIICNWNNFEQHLNTFVNGVKQNKKISTPFPVLTQTSSAALNKKVSEIYVQAKYPSNYLLPLLTKHTHQKIKIAYFSADFYHHATAYLMAELFERHDKTHFEIIAFSFDPENRKDDMRLRLEAAFNQFIDVSHLLDEQIVQLARKLEIDIAIDLKGFTQDCRPNIFAMRAAPIQVNYLGYPGTMGADYIDYLLADTILIPDNYQPYYTEKIVYLPNSYQVNDTHRPISDKTFTREELGLPTHGFIFCCFNNNYKFNPTMFDSWKRILNQVKGSVLWLLADNDYAKKNLRLEAEKRGIAAERLIFAKRLPMAEHLARQRLADLFLDTLPCNAHTTTSDALWVGLPVLTCVGEAFASRVAASLLNAIGLPELITSNLENYEALAIQLATHSEQLAEIKQKLADNRLNQPLFNTVLFTHHIESAFRMMFDRYQTERAPDHIYVQDQENIPTAKTQEPITVKPTPVSIDQLQHAIQLHQAGHLLEAEVLYEQLLQAEPQYADALHYLGLLKNQAGQTQIAVELIQQSLNINPDNSEAHLNLGLVLQALSRFDEALASYDRALAIKPDYDEALFNRANLLLTQNQFEMALANYDQVLTINPNHIEALCNRGIALQGLHRFEDALVNCNRALAIKADYIEVLSNRGNILKELKRFNEALDSYDKALAIEPNDVEILSNRGNVLRELNRLDDAISSYERALTIMPNCTEALCNQGVAFQELNRWHEACENYERVLTINPDYEFLFGTWLSLKMKMCEWDDFERHINTLTNAIEQGKKIATPFSVLSITSSAALQKKTAICYTQAQHPSNFLSPLLVKHTHSKLKIGYFSSDFRHHAVSYLIAELIERHDRSRFEIIAFSLSAVSHKDDMRLRLEAAFDQFIDVSQYSNEQIVRLARQLEIDIAVDLNGCTEGRRTNIFAMRTAPIQVSYIGYLGTMGADYIDYLIADRVLIPKEHQDYYQEKIAYLPHSFQVNDSTINISNKVYIRAELGLPENAFVFCCFNNHYKITPTVFACWMRLLHQVNGSVLWLLGGHVDAESNLRLSASKQGIAPERLVFAQTIQMPEYLARHRLADLFLDTNPYNAGATASAALWAGLPLLTYLGETFPSRMAASLLNAIGLPELVAQTSEEYEILAVKLATHPEQLATIKQKLTDNRLSFPLFNTRLFTQHIECAFTMMFDRYQAGLAPDHIYVPAQSDKDRLPSLNQNSQVTQTNTEKFQQAFRLHQQGQLAEAEAIYEEILLTEPQHVDVLHFLGVLKNQNGQAQLAFELIQQSLKINANNAGAYSNLGMVLQVLNRYDEALISYDDALKLTPNDTNVLLSQANLLQALNRSDEALTCYDKALIINPGFVDALVGRGIVLQILNRFDDALFNYKRVLSIDPDHAEALFGHANVLYTLKHLDEALDSYNHSLAINPDSFEAFYNRGVVLADLSRDDEAIASYRQALAIKPDYVEVLNNLGTLLKKQNRYAEAEASYQSAIAINPEYIASHCNLINLLKDQGLFSQAEVSLKNALGAVPESIELRFIQLIMSLPIVTKNVADSTLASSQFDEALRNLSNWLNSSTRHQEALNKAELLPLPFLLAYRAGNHIQRLSDYGDLVVGNTKPVFHTNRSQKIIRMVVVSHHFRRHSVWDVITRGLLVNLDRSRFELILYHLSNIEDQETVFAKSLANSWRDTHMISELKGWLAALETDAPDVIFYPEIGMDPMSARLASHRLAPLQMASWGHPITTGLPNIDLYFSGELLESLEADNHYRERLIRLPSTGCCTTPINITPEPLAPELTAQLTKSGSVRFIIAQTIYKFDPADDSLYANIASQVNNSLFILLTDRNETWAMNQIIARLEQSFVDRGLNPKQHLLVIPWQTMEKFQTLLDVCDVYLDCPSFSGYTTAWQAVHRGIPIVTLEGEFMRQRLAAGLLRKIGITDTIANSREQYVQLAVKLADESRDPMRRATRRQALKTAAPKADNDVSVVRAFEQSVINALVIDSNSVESLINQGNKLEDLYRLEDALTCYDHALSINPNYARAHSNRGNVLQSLNRFDEALESYDRALEIRPDYAEAYYNRGNTLQTCDRFQEAILSYDLALTLKPDFIQALISRGNAQQACKRFTDALTSYQLALAIQPNYVEALYNQGRVLQDTKRYTEALASYERAITIRPNYAAAHLASSWCYLLLGDYDKGWKEYEWRWQSNDFKNSVRNFQQPQWTGEISLQGKTILLHSEQGLGDTLQFCRYTKLVAELGAKVILEVPKPLSRLLTNLDGVSQLIVHSSTLPAFDFHCPLLSLPLAFKTRLESIPVKSPYLFSEPDKVKHWQTILGEKNRPRIGIVWSGNPAHKNDQNRSLSLQEMLPLLSLPYQFISLQKELRDTDKELLTQELNLYQCGEQLNDFTDTAALCQLMDIIISVDTSVAHLAAAIGKPTWILLPHGPDSRWLLEREDSPWYPTVRLFRQNQQGDWQDVIERLKQELSKNPLKKGSPKK